MLILYLRKEQRKSFSMTDIKTFYSNELMLNLFLSNLEINPKLKKKINP